MTEVLEKYAAVTAGETVNYYAMVRGVAGDFADARKSGDENTMTGLCLLALWTAFNHPKSGEAVRKMVSAKLREKGKVHVTWRYGKDGLAVAVGDKYGDMEKIAKAAPKDRVTVVQAGETSSEPLQ